MKTKHARRPSWIIRSTALIATFGLSFAANAAEPGTITIGSTVHLQNQFGSNTVNVGNSSTIGKTYLDTRGRVMDKPQFKGVDENVFVSTFGTPNRDKGSGSWKIISAKAGVKDGTPLKYGDEIQLLNAYPGAGYLDVWKEKLQHLFDKTNFDNPDATDYSVFTSKNPKGDSSIWIVTAADGKATGEVKNNQLLMLESKSQPKHYLETHGVVTGANGPFKEYKDSVLLVFVSDSAGFELNSEKWQIMLKDAFKTDVSGSASSGVSSGGDASKRAEETAGGIPRSQPPLTKLAAVSNQPGPDRSGRVAFVSSDGSATSGSRSVFTLRNAASGETILVPVQGNEAKTRTEVYVSSGTYEVTPPAPSVNGYQSFYTTKVSAARITVTAGADPALVDFSLGVRTAPVAMRTGKVASDSVLLDWDSLPDVKVQSYTLVRTDGDKEAASETAGTVVSRGDANVKSTVAKGLVANHKYTFTLFSKASDGKDLPIRSITASTSRKVGLTESSYALAPNTIVPDDLASLHIEPVSETSIRVALPANVKRASGSGLPGVAADSLKGNGCVVGTPFLVTTDVAGDQSFYGLIDACEGPATGATTAIVNRHVPLVAVFNYFKMKTGDEQECFDGLTGKPYPAGTGPCTTLAANSAPSGGVPAPAQPSGSGKAPPAPSQPSAPGKATSTPSQSPGPGKATAAKGPTLPFSSMTNLVREQHYWSQSGKHYLVFQADGNLVVYSADGTYIWGLDRQPKTDFRRIARVTWQADGNLAAYAADNQYIWSALQKNPDPKARLVISPEGVLQIVSGNRVMWSASTPLSMQKSKEKIGEDEPVDLAATDASQQNTGRQYAQTRRYPGSELPEVMLVANSRIACEGSGSSHFNLAPSLQPLKKFDIELSFLELKWDIEAGVKASFNPSAEITGTYECSLNLPSIDIPIAGAAIPISLRLKPDISAAATASLTLNGPSLALDVGIESKGRIFDEEYDCKWWRPCSHRMKTEKNAKPIARFTRGNVNANLSGTLTFRAGVDANLGFGKDIGIAKARAGFSLVLSPLSMELKAQAGTSNCVSASVGYQIDAALVSEIYLPLVLDEEKRLPLYESGHQAYPNATFMVGDCGD